MSKKEMISTVELTKVDLETILRDYFRQKLFVVSEIEFECQSSINDWGTNWTLKKVILKNKQTLEI